MRLKKLSFDPKYQIKSTHFVRNSHMQLSLDLFTHFLLISPVTTSLVPFKYFLGPSLSSRRMTFPFIFQSLHSPYFSLFVSCLLFTFHLLFYLKDTPIAISIFSLAPLGQLFSTYTWVSCFSSLHRICTVLCFIKCIELCKILVFIAKFHTHAPL